MQKVILLSLFYCISFSIYSQNEKVYDFFGGKSFVNSTVFYRLVFQIDTNNIVSGYSFTDEKGPKETKSIIQGVYNSKNKTIYFEETKKLSTRNNDIIKKCFLKGRVQLKISKKNNRINGMFFENTKSGSKCVNGKIALLSPDDLSEIDHRKITKKDTKINQKKETIVPNFKTKKKTLLKTNDEISIYWNSDILILEVWDEKKEDNDRITIQINDEILLDNYALRNKKEILEVPIKTKENTIVITANNSGYIGNNTARIDLIDNEITHEIISQLEIKKSVTIHIIKN